MAEWLAENSFTDAELVPLARKGFISNVTITESEETGGYYVTMRIKPHAHIFHLSTRRVRDEPRIYMNLGRLVTHIREKLAPLREVKLVLIPNLAEKQEASQKTKPKVAKTARKKTR
jgi:hypothetical protein